MAGPLELGCARCRTVVSIKFDCDHDKYFAGRPSGGGIIVVAAAAAAAAAFASAAAAIIIMMIYEPVDYMLWLRQRRPLHVL